MILIRREDTEFVFALSTREKELMLALLSFFPQVPVAHHRLCQGANLPEVAEGQRLLEEALETHKAENREWLEESFFRTTRFQPRQNGFHLTIKRDEIERLLQIFNDVRIGSWLALNAPDLEEKKNLLPTRQNAPLIQRMELSAVFEMILLKTLQSPGVDA